jgi:hypothetical protein
MKKCIVCVFVVALISVSCYFATGNPAAKLPGNEVVDGDLKTVWGAKSVVGPQTSTVLCTVLPFTYPVCVAANQPCGAVGAATGTEYHITCTSPTPVNKKVNFSITHCMMIQQTQCELYTSGPNGGLYRCGPSRVNVGVGKRDYCVLTNTALPNEP